MVGTRSILGYSGRQALIAGLTANAIKPLDTEPTAIPAFATGWLSSELAPQLMGLSLADTAIALVRGRATRFGVACSIASVAGLAWMTMRAAKTGAFVETTLRDGIGPDYEDLLDPSLLEEVATPLRALAQPLRMLDPEVEVTRNINYTEGGVRARLDIYRERGADLENAPVLIQIHGGGWTIGRKEEQGLILMNQMAKRGWICVAANYRLSPKHKWPTHIVDVKRAIAWVREHIAEYGGDPDYLVITGGSAGGHLSSLAALTPNLPQFQPGFEDADTHVEACVPFYGVYDMLGEDEDKYTVGLRDMFLAKRVFGIDDTSQHLDVFRDASPLHHVGPDAPDFFVLHGTNDTLVSVRQARAFVEKLRAESKCSVTYAELAGAQHAFEVFGSVRSYQAIRAVGRWLGWHHAAWLRDRTAA